MIENITDINIINYFLKEFNQNIDNLDNAFVHYIGYKKDNKTLGFASYTLIYDRIEIEYIYVLSNYRNQEIASKMLEYITKIGTIEKCLNITLEVKKSNESAIKLYKKNGFKEVALRKNYYQDEDGILMLRELV